MIASIPDPALELAEKWQHDFPLLAHPFAALGESVQLTEGEVLDMFVGLRQRGVLGRIGIVVRPNTIGASTLAAIATPNEHLEETAAIISAEPSVNHNYQRDHHFNLWFVVTAQTREEVVGVLQSISEKTGYDVMDLPIERAYHIDLGFRLSGPRRAGIHNAPACWSHKRATMDQRALLARLEKGLKLVPRPYMELAEQLNWSQAKVTGELNSMIKSGFISRFGCIVNHRKIGYIANAMAVWNVPDDKVDELGERLALIDTVTLCYRRARRNPSWTYNLFAMFHGRQRARVITQIKAAETATGLFAYPGTKLFSERCFKQRGARYFSNLRGAP